MVKITSAASSLAALAGSMFVLLAAGPSPVQAQGTSCLSLNSSSMCPSFAGQCELQGNIHAWWQHSHCFPTDVTCAIPTILLTSRPDPRSCFAPADVDPTGLAPAYPFFADVTDVASFDTAFASYFTEYDQFRQTQLHSGLQCNQSGFLNATLQWSQTVLCGIFTATSDNLGCTPDDDGARTRVCQATCTQYSESEYAFVANASYCTPTADLTDPAWVTTRNNTLNNDYTSCTDWTSIYTANDTACVSGVSNEGNCGFGTGPNAQLCGYCDISSRSSVPSCCYEDKTDLSGCAAFGYPGATVIRPTFSVPAGTTSMSGADAGTPSSGGSGLSKGALAGIIIGSIIGGLLLLALLGLLIWCCCCGGRRKNKQREPESQGVAAAGPRANSASSPSEKPYHPSQDSSRSRNLSQDKGGLAAGALGGAALGAAAASGKHSPTQDPGAPGTGSDSRPLSTATSGTDGRGATVSSVRCQYTGQDIAPGDTVVAIYPYSAGLSDELDLTPESREELSVVRIYDDGWCLLRTPSGKEGAAPLVCCQSSKGELPAHMRHGSSGAFDSSGGTTSGNTDDETSGSRSGGLGMRAPPNMSSSNTDGYQTAGGYTSGGGYQTAGGGYGGGTTSGAEGGMASSAGGAVTADEYGFTSDAASR